MTPPHSPLTASPGRRHDPAATLVVTLAGVSVPRALGGLGLVLLIGGLGMALGAPAAAGWFAYAPQSASLTAAPSGTTLALAPAGGIVVLGGVQITGYVAALLGLVLLTFAGGYAAGRRPTR